MLSHVRDSGKNEDHKLVVFPSAAGRKAALSHTQLQARFGVEKLAMLIEVGKATAKSDPLVEEAATWAVKLAAATGASLSWSIASPPRVKLNA